MAYWVISGDGERKKFTSDVQVLKEVKAQLESGIVTSLTIVNTADRHTTRGIQKAVKKLSNEDVAVLGEQASYTNIKAAAVEGHKLCTAKGTPYYIYGESGRYKLSATKPEAELRYIQITPGGNEWTWSYDASADRWTKSRLGMVTAVTEEAGPEMDRILQLAGLGEPEAAPVDDDPVSGEPEVVVDWAAFEDVLRDADWSVSSDVDALWARDDVQFAVQFDPDRAVALWNKYAPEGSQAVVSD